MAFGAFAPLPLRLGGSKQEGWTPEQHARLCADLCALYNSQSFAVLTYTKSGATITVTAYSGRNGVGISFAPTPTVLGTGEVKWTWPATWTDACGEVHTIAFKHADAEVGAVDAVHMCGTYDVLGRNVTVIADSDNPVTLEVWTSETRRPAHYGGSLDKRVSKTEGNVPYAWGWYRHYQSAMGSAYTTDRTGLVHCENLADARRQAAKMRAAERLEKNSIPTTSDERLAYWATVMRVPFVATDVTEDVRTLVAAKAQLAVVQNRTALDAALTTLLGDAFVQTNLTAGTDLDNPPDYTWWPTINPGDPVSDLGRGTWMSSRCMLSVEVQTDVAPPDAPPLDFLRLVFDAAPALLDEALPSYATWSVAVVDRTNGFQLDLSRMDLDAFD
jgi:hypothetical protein